ncbi:MAG: hypothetical protein OXM54_13635 [Acidimicrobiaceae bacterium]|nr:hypothetical protein [Acidimicrobiaceae bacterium]MDE0321769.1 hypothetical protein [Acidimicrobiaceae bacterium]
MASETERRRSGPEHSAIRKLAAMTWRERDAYYSQMSSEEVQPAITEILGRHLTPAKEQRRYGP